MAVTAGSEQLLKRAPPLADAVNVIVRQALNIRVAGRVRPPTTAWGTVRARPRRLIVALLTLACGAGLIAAPASVGAAQRSWTLNGRNAFAVAGTDVLCIVQTKFKGSGIVACARKSSQTYGLLFGTGALAVINEASSGPPLFYKTQPYKYKQPPVGLTAATHTSAPEIVLAPGDRIFVVATDIRCDVIGKPRSVVCSLVSGRTRLANSYSASISGQTITASNAVSRKPVYRLAIG